MNTFFAPVVARLLEVDEAAITELELIDLDIAGRHYQYAVRLEEGVTLFVSNDPDARPVARM